MESPWRLLFHPVARGFSCAYRLMLPRRYLDYQRRPGFHHQNLHASPTQLELIVALYGVTFTRLSGDGRQLATTWSPPPVYVGRGDF